MSLHLFAACSVENQLEKNTEEIISRLREMRDQIDKKFSRLDGKLAEQSDLMSAEMNRMSAAVQAEMNRLNNSLESNMMSKLGFIHEVYLILRNIYDGIASTRHII